MRGNELPFEIMDIYNRKILSNRAKLALLRVKREKMVRPKERAVFGRLSSLLETACEGDTAITDSQMKATSEESLLTLRESLIVLRGQFKETESIQIILRELLYAANELSEGRIPDNTTLKRLEEFVVKYNAIQSENLREPNNLMSSEKELWPLRQIGYSLIP